MAISADMLVRRAIEEHYDVIVLGTQVPALVAAALCAKQGLRVAVLGQARHPPSYQLAHIDVPTSLPFLAAPSSELGKTVQRELSLSAAFSSSASLGLCTPSRRVSLQGSEDRIRREIAREFPSHEEMWTRWMKQGQRAQAQRVGDMQSPARGRLAAMNAWVRELRTHFDRPHTERTSQPPPPPVQSDELWRLATAVYRFYSSSHVSSLQTEQDWDARGAALSQLTHGSLVDPIRFTSDLLARVERVGGTVQLPWSAMRIRRESTGFAIPLRQQRRILRCSEIVAGCDCELLEELFEQVPDALREWNERPRTHLRFVVNVICKRDCIPSAAPRQLIAYDYPDRANLHIVLRDLRDGKTLIAAEQLFSLGRSNTSERIDRARDDVLDHLLELFPDLQEGIVAVDSPHDGRSPTSLTEEKITSTLDLWSRGPQFARRLLREGPGATQPPHPHRLGPGLWFAGDASAMGMGFDGAAAVANEIRHACEHHQPRRFRRRVFP